MTFAKLILGCPQYAPNPIRIGNDNVGNPPASLYYAQGYKPIREAPYPADPAEIGCRWEALWTEAAESIIQSWVQVPVPPDEELSGDEALRILLGGDSE